MAANEKESYPWLDPLMPPKCVSDNPHTKRTRSSDPPPELPTSHVAYTDVIYDHLFLPLNQLLGNVCPEQAELVRTAPEDFLAVVPYRAGNGLFREKGNQWLNQDILAFLKTLRFPGVVDEADMALADLATTTEGATPSQVEAVLQAQDEQNPDTKGMQTFAIDKVLTFSVLEFEPTQFSWVISNFSGDSVSCEVEGEILTAIKHTLWYHNEFCFLVDKILTKAGIPGTVNDHVVHVIATFTIAFFDNTDEWGWPATIVQLHSKPITMDGEDHQAYLHIIRTMRFWVDMVQLKLAESIDCQLCKADTHPTYGCPFFKMEGWYGLTYDGAECH
ncbi:hypothetical protein WOLCODRAFT_158700 [Wolfiporia cocos MD-104 SS10]|uniref:Uncharacterized protein n=1 Tax=Wolfiporia cocos (strain MD-104) TaxID=742152 RepID=A0A2H3JB78_WOLCO|nr:hypothetical protein WOLCODRAFT_158700 [Wolfiporia cocos MD-104 SS10]